MISKKAKNIGISLGILAAWVCIVIILAALSSNDPNNISLVYIWVRFSGLLAGFGGLLFLALRIFKSIDRSRIFLYTLLGTANLILGLCGVTFYFMRKINTLGLHDLLPNLLIGVIIFTDIFQFETIFKKGPPK